MKHGSVTYKLTHNLGIGMEIQYLLTGLIAMRSLYHDEKIKVTFDKDNNSDLSRLNISAGMSYYF